MLNNVPQNKLYIYTCNKDDKDLNIPEFQNKLKYYIMTEKQILSNKGKLDVFDQKYRFFYDRL